LKLEVLYDDR